MPPDLDQVRGGLRYPLLHETTLVLFDWERKDYDRILIEEQVEVLSLTGDISLAPDSTPQLHLHVVLGKRDGHDPASGLALIEMPPPTAA